MTMRNPIPVLATLLSALCVNSAAADNETRILKMMSRITELNQYVDLGEQGPSAGDIYVFVDELLAPDGGVKLGRIVGRCTMVDPSRTEFECTMVAALAAGTLTTEGMFRNLAGEINLGTVTGGTGQYRGARGESKFEVGTAGGPNKASFLLLN
jgi:hypothetical protein